MQECDVNVFKKDIAKLCKGCSFFISAQLPEWLLSLEDFKLAFVEPIYRYKYLTCVFPLLENCIRKVFAVSNKAPERILIAGKSVAIATK